MKEIELSLGDNGAFYPGDTIEGTLTVRTTEPLMNAESILLHFYGEERTETREDVQVHVRQRRDSFVLANTHFQDTVETEMHNVFKRECRVRLDHQVTLCSLGSGSLAAGTHTHNFSFQLPTDIPPTFKLKLETAKASISYKCVGVVYGPNRKSPFLRTEQPIVVRIPAPEVPMSTVENDAHKANLVCGCVPQGNVSLYAKIMKQMFFGGDTIGVDVEVVNQSRKKIKDLKVRLKVVMILTAHGFQSKHEATLFRHVSDVIPPREHATKTIPIAVTPAMNSSTAADLVHFHYEVQVSCCDRRLCVCLPLDVYHRKGDPVSLLSEAVSTPLPPSETATPPPASTHSTATPQLPLNGSTGSAPTPDATPTVAPIENDVSDPSSEDPAVPPNCVP
eukprot:Rmarinus@m.26247